MTLAADDMNNEGSDNVREITAYRIAMILNCHDVQAHQWLRHVMFGPENDSSW
jgi:hypothetical protein